MVLVLQARKHHSLLAAARSSTEYASLDVLQTLRIEPQSNRCGLMS